MPCSDVTDYLELELDLQDRIKSYNLRKLTCGRTVGGSLLLSFIKNRAASEVLIDHLEDLVPDLDKHADVENFLFHKQLFSLQSALSALTGNAPGYQTAEFEIEKVTYDTSGIFISGYIALDHVKVQEIAACGNCACASKKKKKNPPPLIPLKQFAHH